MSKKLTQAGVKRALKALSNTLTKYQLTRLEIIADRLNEEGNIPIDDALRAIAEETKTSLKPDSFREFRSAIEQTAAGAGISFTLVADKRSSTLAHFEGEDLLAQEMTERSTEEAKRKLPDVPVEADAYETRPYRIYISVAEHEGARDPEADKFIDKLRQSLGVLPQNPGYEIASSYDIACGEAKDDWEHHSFQEADIILVLLTQEYLTTMKEFLTSQSLAKPLIPVKLRPIKAGAELGRIKPEEIFCDQISWTQQNTEQQRSETISNIIAAITTLLSTRESSDQAQFLKRHNDRIIKSRRSETEKLVEADAVEQEFDPPASRTRPNEDPSNYGSSPGGHRPQVRAVQRLTEWARATNPKDPRLAALLGNIGMGKSTTLQQLALALAELRENEGTVPLPILFDLRELTGRKVDDMSPEELLDCLLLGSAGKDSTATGRDILEVIEQGGCVLIFDGLDEALVHLSENEGHRLIRRLWQIAGQVPTTRLIISCRTHFFRTLRDEASVFLGQGREGIEAKDYLVLHMLPFTPTQIREYIQGNVEQSDIDPHRVEQIMSMIGSVYNLSELAKQPLLLSMIVKVFGDLETRISSALSVTSTDLYTSFVEQWLARDSGKHQLITDHKLLLMQELAAQLWRRGRRTWSAIDLENWMLRFMKEHPDFELHYPAWTPELWKEDLRTATFVTRNGDEYSFAHTSLLEYFLARHLARLLSQGVSCARADWANIQPSIEAERFLAEFLSGMPAQERDLCLMTLTELGRDHEAGERVLRFAAVAPTFGLIVQNLSGLDVRERNLDDLRLDDTAQLDLSEARFDEARLRRARFRNANFAKAHFDSATLMGASFEQCTFTETEFTGTDLSSTTFRHCDLTQAKLKAARARQTGAIDTRGIAFDEPGWLLAPREEAFPEEPKTLTGHTRQVTSASFSPDATLILTSSDDGTARIWDTHTGQPLHTLTGHTRPVTSASFSPDATLTLTSSDDHTARIWDTHTGQPLHTLTGHTRPVTSASFSPDATLTLTSSDDHTARIWDTHTGQPLHTLTGHTDQVTSASFSPDATLTLTSSTDGTVLLWSVETGKQRGPQLELLPEQEVVVRDGTTQRVIGASEGAWRWLAHIQVRDGRAVRLPGESSGVFPSLSALASKTANATPAPQGLSQGSTESRW